MRVKLIGVSDDARKSESVSRAKRYFRPRHKGVDTLGIKPTREARQIAYSFIPVRLSRQLTHWILRSKRILIARRNVSR